MKFIPDSQSFLFTLVNPTGNVPVTITPKPGAGGIKCQSDYGPTFGASQCYDLQVWSTGLDISTSGYLDLGYGFTCLENVNNKTFFTGKSEFSISELEVFQVNL